MAFFGAHFNVFNNYILELNPVFLSQETKVNMLPDTYHGISHVNNLSNRFVRRAYQVIINLGSHANTKCNREAMAFSLAIVHASHVELICKFDKSFIENDDNSITIKIDATEITGELFIIRVYDNIAGHHGLVITHQCFHKRAADAFFCI